MNIRELVEQMDTKVSRGAIVDAVIDHFADGAKTKDYGNAATSNKSEMVQKMASFLQ